jgi:Holliday junction DNA helicase RuvA
MISRIEGTLIGVEGGRVELDCPPLTYQVLVPAADEMRYSGMIGQTILLHTLHYLEAQGQGSSFVPRLIGFRSVEDRRFFELFTTVKGLGARKALRALQLPFASVAEAIATKDQTMLVSLPEIGKRTAETIIAELHGKVDRFIEFKPDVDVGDGGGTPGGGGTLELLRDAAAILIQLGESPAQARGLAERALSEAPELQSADDVVATAFRLKEIR